MIAPTKAIQEAAQREVERIHNSPTLTREDYAAYTTLLDLAIYPPDIEDRIIREDGPEWSKP